MITKILTWFFVMLGIIFFFLLLLAAYLWVTDPWGIKPFIMRDTTTMPTSATITPEMDSTTVGEEKPVAHNDSSTAVSDPTDKHPNLTASQEDALELIGVDPGVLPSEITREQEACFVAKLGAERVLAIKAGATPGGT
jgi:hypothetical protein